MPDMATIVSSISILLVAVAALVVSVGVFYLIVRIGRALEVMMYNSPRNDGQIDDTRRGGG